MRLWINAGIILLVAACGRAPEDHSSPKQLTPNLIKCVDYSDSQVSDYLSEMPDGFFVERSWDRRSLALAKNRLTGIPKRYLNWLYRVHDYNGFNISQRNLSRGVAGLTRFSSDPILIQIGRSPGDTELALQHEVGHAMHVAFKRKAGFDSSITRVYNLEKNNRYLRSYARQAFYEYFAESFSNYYCSKESHHFIKSQLPRTYQVLRQELLPPRWEENENPADIRKTIVMRLLPSQGDVIPVEAATQKDVTDVILCNGTFESCVKNKTADVRFRYENEINGKKIWKSTTGVKPQAGKIVTIMGLDANQAVISGRAIQFNANISP